MKTQLDFLSKVDSLLEANYKKSDFGVTELAKKLFVSRSQLHRKITASSGKSASNYISEYRLKKAYILLQKGQMTTSEIAYEVGFSSPSYFSTAFKKLYSFTPTQSVNTENEDSFSAGEKEKQDLESNHYNSGETLSFNKGRRRIIYPLAGLVILIFVFIFFYMNHSQGDTIDEKWSMKDKSIAVLPFRNFSNDGSLDAFCFGLTDEIISGLSILSDFDRVISRTTAFNFNYEYLGIPEIANQLNVSYILEGNLQKSKDQLKINVQLIDAKEDNHVWTDQYTLDWGTDEIFEIQSMITQFVTNAMKVTMSKLENENIRKQLTTNKRAYDLYLRAKFHMHSSDEESMLNAKKILNEVITLDPQFAEAYTSLGYIWAAGGFGDYYVDPNLAWEKAKEYFYKAQELKPSLVINELYLYQGYFYNEWDFIKLEKFFHSRFLKQPYDRETSGLLDYAIKTERPDIALEATEKSIEVDPVDAILFSFKARALWFLDRKEEGIEILERMDALGKNDWFYLREATHNYFIMQEYEHCRKNLEIVMTRYNVRSPILLFIKLFLADMDGDLLLRDQLLTELEIAYHQNLSGSPAWFIALYHLSIKYNVEKAFEWLEKSYERREVELTWLIQEPLLKPIKNDERYWSLYQRIGFGNLVEM